MQSKKNLASSNHCLRIMNKIIAAGFIPKKTKVRIYKTIIKSKWFMATR